MKIGILTHYNVNNMGAQLQMYFMKAWLEEHGIEVCIWIYDKNFDLNKEEQKKNSGSLRNIPYYFYNYLIKRGFGLTLFNYKKTRKIRKLQIEEHLCFAPYDHNDCDAVIIGSDEVFSIQVGCNRMMYGYGFNQKAIAYAPSFGMTDVDTLKENGFYELISEGLKTMHRVSSRDIHTQKMIEALCGRETTLVCDPVLLFDKTVDVPVKQIPYKFMLIYAYDQNMTDEKEVQSIKKYAKKHSLKTLSIGTYHKWCDGNIVCDPLEWYSYFSQASIVLTDTFHGAIAAIRHHCELAVFIRKNINANKIGHLMNSLQMSDRIIASISAEEIERVFSNTTDYSSVEQSLEEIRRVSNEYLIEGINSL